MQADAPRSTVDGNTFIAPAQWTIEVRGKATVLAPPEPDAHIAFVDVEAPDADVALARAWAAYKPDAPWKMTLQTEFPDKNGWSKIRSYDYQTSPNEKRTVNVVAQFANGKWLVSIYDMPDPVGEKRAGQIELIFGRLYPKGYSREMFDGKTAAKLDAAKLDELKKYVTTAMQELQVPGVALGIVQDGKIVWSGGFGSREQGKKPAVDGDTLFMIASNTKALTTLMLAKLVDAKQLAWDTPATSLLPSFKLGSAETTKQVLVKHLICACTGLPRQDLEWLFEFKKNTPEGAMATLGTMQPTSKFGEMFQYSNPLAAAAGFIGGHVAFPKLELGAGYDKAMQTFVFDPLGMKSTTFDYARALRGNHASPHSPDIDGKMQRALMELNYSVVPLRPAGAAWSSVNDMLKYVAMELAEGKLPDGKQYVAKEPLLERRVPQVPIGKDVTYGMGLEVDTQYGVAVVHHGGDMIGFHSDMIWIPSANVGAVILTDADGGWLIRGNFRRKLLEVLYDGRHEADADTAAAATAFYAQLARDRKLLDVPADAAESAKLARHYKNDALGEIAVTHAGKTTVFDFGEFKTEVASKRNPDGTVSFVTIAPGAAGFEFVAGLANNQHTLMIRDGQHEYMFTEQ